METSSRQSPHNGPDLLSPSPKELLIAPGKKALRLILDSPTPAHLVQSLAEEDLFWLVQGIGPEDALPVLSLASNDQWQYLLDLELWEKDRLAVASVNRWLDLLLKADSHRFLIWGLRQNLELIELHLSRNIDVRIREEDESPSDFEEGYFTLDDVFYIRIRHEEYDQTVTAFLRHLADHDLNRFQQVMLELVAVQPAEAEENLYRRRNVRLAEKGFLPFEEAIGIYQRLDAEDLLNMGRQVERVLQQPHLPQPISVSTSLHIQDQGLFFMALRHIRDHHTLERLQLEFAGMCNQIISADSLSIREKEDLAAVVRKACGYLDIGLQELDAGDPDKGARLVEKYALNQIFRVGYGAGLQLKWKAEKWVRNSWFVKQGLGLSFWGLQWEGLLEGLLWKRPLYYADLREGEPYREFKALEEITRCRKAVDQIMALDRLLSRVLTHGSLTHPMKAYQPLNYKNLLLTCFARNHLGLSEEVKPLLVKDFKAFFRNLLGADEKPRLVVESMKQSFRDWLVLRSGLAAAEIQGQVGDALDSLFRELEIEYGSVSIEDLDPRYVKHILVTP
jgi:hypothetical protein